MTRRLETLKIALREAHHNTCFQMVRRNLFLILVSGNAIVYGLPLNMAGTAWDRFLWSWSWAPAIPFIISSLPRWLFLGEAERYFEYSAFPVAILLTLALLTSAHSSVLWAFVVIAFVLNLIWDCLLRRRRARMDPAPDTEGLVTMLQTMKLEGTVLTIPNQLGLAIAYRVSHTFAGALDTVVWERDYDRLFVRYPWPSNDLGWWRQTHHVAAVVLRKSFLMPENGCTWQYDLRGFQKRFENTSFEVWIEGDASSSAAKIEID